MVAQEASGGRLSGVTPEGRLEVDSSPHPPSHCKQRGFIEHLLCTWLARLINLIAHTLLK